MRRMQAPFLGIGHKFGVSSRAARSHSGITFASKAEADRAALLNGLVRQGHTIGWAPQPKFQLGCPENIYVADAVVLDGDGIHVEDPKGFRTPAFKKNLRLWREYGRWPLWLLTRRGQGWRVEVIPPGRSGWARFVPPPLDRWFRADGADARIQEAILLMEENREPTR